MHPSNTRPPQPPRPRSQWPCITRRRLLAGCAVTAGASLLAACGAEPAPIATPAPPTPTGATAPRPTVASAPIATVVPTTVPAMPAAPTAAAALVPMMGATRPASTGTGSAAASPAPATSGAYPSPAPGVPDAYDKIPAPFKAVASVPGKGSKVTILHVFFNGAAPAPRDGNPYWQELEKRLGVTYEPGFVPSASYDEKFATAVAGGELSDLTFITNTAAQLQAINQGAFADLSPFLMGDGLKEFPNLATVPDQIWKNLMIRGKIYGVPGVRGVASNPLMFRQDWADKVGISQPKNADEFYELMVRFTKNDPDGNGAPDTFGLGSGSGQLDRFSLPFMRYMFRVPNEWRKNADGSLTYFVETDEFKQTLEYMRRLYSAGIFHPDAATMNSQQAKAGFAGGKFGAYPDAVTGLSDGIVYTTLMVNPNAKPTGLTPPGFDGGPAVTYNGLGWGYYLAISGRAGRDRERTKELLRVLDYFCAPFGSEEWRFINFGIEGVHHTIQPDGSLVPTMQATRDIGDFKRTANGPQSYYYPAFPGLAREMQGIAQRMVAVGVYNPTNGQFSATAATKGTELTQFNTDRLIAIVTGRDPLSAHEAWVRDWRSRGGDTIRKEFEQALKGQ